MWQLSDWILFERPATSSSSFANAWIEPTEFGKIEVDGETLLLVPGTLVATEPMSDSSIPEPEKLQELSAISPSDQFWDELMRRNPPKPDFFGLYPDGEKIVFLIDVSGSMLAWAGAETRLRTAFREVSRAFASLRPPQSFNIVLFADRIESFRPHPVPANTSNKTAAYQWLMSEPDCGGTTNLSAGLQTAMAMRPDVILLLSDGAANRENHVILAEFEHLLTLHNKQPRVHAVGYHLQPEEPAELLLRKLSALTGGRYARWHPGL